MSIIVELELQPITREWPSSITQDGVRLDIAMSGFWGGRHEKTFFYDVRVLTPMLQPTEPPLSHALITNMKT